MKKTIFRVAALLLIGLVVFAFTGCEQLTGNDEAGSTNSSVNGDETSDVSFDNFTTRSVSVKNNTGERLVAFKGEISPGALISGVPAYASNHGLKKDSGLFSATEEFALLFITEEAYIENKSNLSALRNSPFASIYGFYNNSGDNNNLFEISSYSGGSAELVVQNNSPFSVEIRMNGQTGEVLGYVPAYTANTTLKVEPGDYVLFPIFKKYLERDNEIYSIKPTFTGGAADGKPYFYQVGITSSESWNLTDVYDPSTIKLTAGGFYLTVNNQSGSAIQFLQGGTVYYTSIGIASINSGYQQTYFIPFEQNADGTYPDEVSFSQFSLGSALIPFDIPGQEFKNNMKYTILTEGADASNITLGEVTEAGEVDIISLFDL